MSPALAGRFFIPLVPLGKPITEHLLTTALCALRCAVLWLVTQSCPTLCNPMDCSLPGSSVHGDSAGKNIGEGCLQGIFPTQGANTCLLHCRQILDHLSHKGSPRILKWIACPFSRGTFWPRNQTGVFCSAGGLFDGWATREAQQLLSEGKSMVPGIKMLVTRPESKG